MYSSILSNDSVLSLQNNDIYLNKNYALAGQSTAIKPTKSLKNISCPVNASSATFEDRSKTNLIINYLPQSYDQEDLQCLFEQIGPIRQCKLIKDKISGTSLCYGFVDFIDPQHAALAIQSYHGYETEQKRLRVAYASSGNKKLSDTSFSNATLKNFSYNSQLSNLDLNDVIGWEVSVSGIPSDKTEQDLCKMFNNFGKVLSVKMVSKYHNTKINDIDCENTDYNTSKKILMARIIYEDRIAAESAVHCLNGMNIPDTPYILSVSVIGSVNRDSLYNRITSQNNNNILSTLNDFGLNDITPPVNIKNGFDSSKTRNPLISKSINFPQNQITRPIIRSKCEIQQHNNPVSCQFNENSNGFPNFQPTSNPPLTFHNYSPLTAQSRQLNSNLSNTQAVFSQQPFINSSPLNQLPSSVFLSTMGLSAKSTKLSSRTQLLLSVPLTNHLNKKGFKAQVFLKLENLQITGSFKIRGIEDLFSKILIKAKGQQQAINLVCPCPGLNRAITCVYCAHVYQINCTLIVPVQIERILLHQIDSYLNINLSISSHISIVSYGNSYNDCFIKAQSLVQELNTSANFKNKNNGSTNFNPSQTSTAATGNQIPAKIEYRLVNVVDAPEVYSAYDSIVDEIISDMNSDTPNVIVLPIGSGSLTAGIIQGLWNHNLTDVKLVTMEADTNSTNNNHLTINHNNNNDKYNNINPISNNKNNRIGNNNSKSTCASSSSSTHSSENYPSQRSTTNSNEDTNNVIHQQKAGLLLSSLTCAPLSMETLQKILCHPITCFTCNETDAMLSVKRFLNDHAMLIEPAAGVALSAIYNDNLVRMHQQNLLPDNAKIVVIVTGGRDISTEQLLEWDQQFGQLLDHEHHQFSSISEKIDLKNNNNSIYEIQSNEINSLTTVNSVVDSLFSTNTPTKHCDDLLSNGSITTGNGSDSGLADPELTFTVSTTKSAGSTGSNSSQILPIGHNRPQQLIHRSQDHQQQNLLDTSDNNPFENSLSLSSGYDPNCQFSTIRKTSGSSSSSTSSNNCSNNTGSSSPLSMSTAASSIESSNSGNHHHHHIDNLQQLNNLEQFLNLKNLSEIN